MPRRTKRDLIASGELTPRTPYEKRLAREVYRDMNPVELRKRYTEEYYEKNQYKLELHTFRMTDASKAFEFLPGAAAGSYGVFTRVGWTDKQGNKRYAQTQVIGSGYSQSNAAMMQDIAFHLDQMMGGYSDFDPTDSNAEIEFGFLFGEG